MFGSVIISPYLCNVKFKVQPAMANGNIIIGELGSGDAPPSSTLNGTALRYIFNVKFKVLWQVFM